MKKFLTVLVIAALVASSAFAGVSLTGKAFTELAYNFDSKILAFAPSTEVKATIDATTAEKINEGDVYAGIKATLSFKGVKNSETITDEGDGTVYFPLLVDKFEVKEAYITDGNIWKLSILNAQGVSTFAKDFTYNEDDDAYTDSAKNIDKMVEGVTLTVYDWQVGAGVNADFNEGGYKAGLLSVKTPSFAVMDGLTIQGAAGLKKDPGVWTIAGGADVAYTGDFTVKAAADIYTEFQKDQDAKFYMDARASFSYAPVTVDAYYASLAKLVNDGTYKTEMKLNDAKNPVVDNNRRFFITSAWTKTDKYGNKSITNTQVANLLDFKVVADLASFDVPVAITVVGLDVINSQYFDVEAKATFDPLTVAAFGGYQHNFAVLIDEEMEKTAIKTVHVGGEVSYDLDKIGIVCADVTYAQGFAEGVDSKALNLNAYLKNETLVSGATLKAGYASGNLLADKAEAGKVYASCEIKF